jgi:hypothetical protein
MCDFENQRNVPGLVTADLFTVIIECKLKVENGAPLPDIRNVTVTVTQATGAVYIYPDAQFCSYPSPEHWIDDRIRSQSRLNFAAHHRTHPVTLAACTMLRTDLVRFGVPNSQLVLEWIAYHLLQGFRHFLIYPNEDPAHIRRILAPYIADGLVDIVDWEWRTPGFQHQPAHINSCLYRYRGLAQWVGVFDVDEFLQPLGQGDTVRAIVERRTPAIAALRVSCVWFFSCRGCPPGDGALQTQRYAYRSTDALPVLSKCLARPENILTYIIHMPSAGGKVAAANPSKLLRLNHYKNRTVDEVYDPSMAAYGAAIAAEVRRVTLLAGGAG